MRRDEYLRRTNPPHGILIFVERQMAGHRKGFTLIEILMVVVVIGSLTAIAIPHYSASKKKAYAAAMQADLHIIACTKSSRRRDMVSTSPGPRRGPPLNGFTPHGLTITTTAFKSRHPTRR